MEMHNAHENTKLFMSLSNLYETEKIDIDNILEIFLKIDLSKIIIVTLMFSSLSLSQILLFCLISSPRP